MATVRWTRASAAGAVSCLALVLTGCRLIAGHASIRAAVDGVAAVTNGVAMQDAEEDGQPQKWISDVSPELLRAIGMTEPDLSDHALLAETRDDGSSRRPRSSSSASRAERAGFFLRHVWLASIYAHLGHA